MRPAQSVAGRIVLTALGLVIWFWTQSLIGARPLPAAGFGDGLFVVTAPLNQYLREHPAAADALLVVSSAVIDCMGLLLIGKWLIGAAPRPFVNLVLVLGLRQLMQALVALPEPPNMIWRHPGVPSLFVTYGVANDYYFSGHTAIATLGALELARIRKHWVVAVAAAIVLFEATTVIALRAHYTMDVFTGLMTALYVSRVTSRIWPEPGTTARAVSLWL
jgi:hypothetical protein